MSFPTFQGLGLGFGFGLGLGFGLGFGFGLGVGPGARVVGVVVAGVVSDPPHATDDQGPKLLSFTSGQQEGTFT